MPTPEVRRDREAAARRREKIAHLVPASQPMLPGLEPSKTVFQVPPASRPTERPSEDEKPPIWWAN